MIGTVQRNIFHRLGDAFTAYKAGVPNPAMLAMPQAGNSGGAAFPLVWPGWDAYERTTPAQSRDLARAKVAVTSPWVFSDITAIANEASVATLQIKERDTSDEGETDVENHPLELVWESPNPFMGRSFLMSYWIWQRLLSGKAFLYWVPKTDGTLGEVWPVPSFMMTPIPDPKRVVSGYLFKRNDADKGIAIDAKYITYSRLPHPFNLLDGLSPLAAIYDDVEADLAMARWNKTFFSKENAAPSGLITVPKDTLDSDIQRIRMEIMDFFSNTSGRRVGVARAGDMDWKPFDRSQKDMEFLQGRGFIRAEVDRVFGFPEGYWSKDATRANSEGAKATMIENAVWPHLVALAEDLNAQTLPSWFDPNLRAVFDDIRPRNRALELQEFTAYQAVRRVDELRAMIGDDEMGDPRGKMLVAEIVKGTPIPATPASDDTEAALSKMEDDAGITTGAQDAAPEDGAAPEEAPEDTAPPTAPMSDPGSVFSKSVGDLDRWQSKALKRLKDKGNAAAPFLSDAIPPEDHARITAALKAATTPADVRAAFDGDAVFDAVEAEALAWAKKVLE
jgi:HK97 family phage portal protein